MSDDRDRAVLSDQQLANVRLGHDYTKPHGDCLTCRVLATMDAALTKVRRDVWDEVQQVIKSEHAGTVHTNGCDCHQCTAIRELEARAAEAIRSPGPVASPPPELEEAGPCKACRGGGIKLYSRSAVNPYGEPCPKCIPRKERTP